METCRTVASTSRFATACTSARRALAQALVLTALVAAGPGTGLAATRSAAASASPLEEGVCQLREGQWRLAVATLQTAYAAATAGPDKARAAAALGDAYLRQHRLTEAEPLLAEAMAGLAEPRPRAAAALDLGNLQLARRQYAQADASWALALAQAPADAELSLSVELNRLRLPTAQQRQPRLEAAASQLDRLPANARRAELALNIAAQARTLPAQAGTALAWRLFEQGRQDATAAQDDRLAAQAYDGLSDLYEQQQRSDEALRLVERGLWFAQRADAHELLVTLEWRAGRLTQRQGRADLALAAYRRAVHHIEAIRSDIPVQYEDGRSSFRATLEPIYLGLTDLLLAASDQAGGSGRSALLRQARDTVELIKQTELEDFLRDRCSVGSARNEQAFVLPPGTAIYYPIILPDRLELLLETAQGIERRSVPVDGETLRRSVLELVSAMRSGTAFQGRAEAMYRRLIEPIDGLLTAQGITTLVAVPDGVLRLLPLGALHNGREFLIQRLAVATVPGLTMTSTSRTQGARFQTLLAGMSEPGPVVDKLSTDMVNTLIDPPKDVRQARGLTRSMRGGSGIAAGDLAGATTEAERSRLRANALREALALPGVKQEIENIARVVTGTSLLDGGFTLAALKQQLLSQNYSVVHIASHGVFGDSADDTFIMTYDELLTLDGLQALLRDRRLSRTPIELITLSACQTAEGDDRAPLGMSGTALKARARSALGTLWPVSDEAANLLMTRFYQLLALGQHSKVGALRAAQVELIGKSNLRHPFHWAPFILIGDWQ